MPQSSGTKSKTFSPEDLQEFRLRKNTLDYARNLFLMVEESYQAWTIKAGKKYKFRGKFKVNAATGELTPFGGSTNGGSNTSTKTAR